MTFEQIKTGGISQGDLSMITARLNSQLCENLAQKVETLKIATIECRILELMGIEVNLKEEMANGKITSVYCKSEEMLLPNIYDHQTIENWFYKDGTLLLSFNLQPMKETTIDNLDRYVLTMSKINEPKQQSTNEI